MEKERENAKRLVEEQEANIENFFLELFSHEAIISSLKKDLDLARADYGRLSSNLDSLVNSQDDAMKQTTCLARKEVKGEGKDILEQVDDYVNIVKKRASTQSDVNELMSNQATLEGLASGSSTIEVELVSVKSLLVEAESELAAIPDSTLDLKEMASTFADFPPLSDTILIFPEESEENQTAGAQPNETFDASQSAERMQKLW